MIDAGGQSLIFESWWSSSTEQSSILLFVSHGCRTYTLQRLQDNHSSVDVCKQKIFCGM